MCTVWAALFLFLSPFPFRYRFAALLRTPSPLAPSLSFIHLSLSSSLNHVPFFFFPAPPSPPHTLPSPPSAPLRSSFPTLRLRPSFSRPARPLSLVISSSFARSRFFSRFFHRPLRFFLSLMPTVLVPFAYHHRLLSLFLTPSSLRAVPSSSLPSLSTYPAASVETARFFPPVSSAPIFFTPFSLPLPPLRRLPMRRSPPPSEYRLEHSLHLPLCRVAHTHMVSLSLSSRLSSALFLLSFVHLSLPSHLSFIFPCLSPPPLSLSLSLLPPLLPPPPPSTPAAPIFLIFFSQLPDHLPTPRVGVLFLSGRSSRPSARPRTRVHTYVRSQPAREGETER